MPAGALPAHLKTIECAVIFEVEDVIRYREEVPLGGYQAADVHGLSCGENRSQWGLITIPGPWSCFVMTTVSTHHRTTLDEKIRMLVVVDSEYLTTVHASFCVLKKKKPTWVLDRQIFHQPLNNVSTWKHNFQNNINSSGSY